MKTQKELNKQLLEAAKKGDAAEARALVEKGADPNAADKYGMTALMLAAMKGRTATARELLAAGADVNAADNLGFTALKYAVREGYAETAQALIDKGADVQTAALLMFAAMNGHTETARALLAAGAARAAAAVTLLTLGLKEDADKALATLYAAGAFALDAAAIEACCEAALEGLVNGGDEEAALNAALEKLRG